MSEKVAFIADLHVGNHRYGGGVGKSGINHRCEIVLAALDHALAQAKRRGCTRFVILGDIFDSSNPSPQIVYNLALALTQWGDDMQIELLVGNHDQVSSDKKDHALAPYCDELLGPHVSVIEEWTVSEELLYIPFETGPASEWLPKRVDAAMNHTLQHYLPKPKALAFHLGISDDNTPPFLKACDDQVSIDDIRAIVLEHEFDLVAAGNWHKPMQWHLESLAGFTCNVIQCGTVAPVNFGDAGITGRMVVWDSEHNLVDYEAIDGPRFVKLRGLKALENYDWEANALDLESPTLSESTGCWQFVRAIVDREHLDRASSMKDDLPLGCHLEIIPDDSEAEAYAATAAQEARDADGVDEAIHSFVDGVPLEEPGTRAGVLRRVKEYQKAACALAT